MGWKWLEWVWLKQDNHLISTYIQFLNSLQWIKSIRLKFCQIQVIGGWTKLYSFILYFIWPITKYLENNEYIFLISKILRRLTSPTHNSCKLWLGISNKKSLILENKKNSSINITWNWVVSTPLSAYSCKVYE